MHSISTNGRPWWSVKTAVILLSLLGNSHVQGQSADSLKLLVSNDWRTVQGWFGDDKVVLTPLPQPDITGLSAIEKAEVLERNNWGEKISFSSDGQLIYTYHLSCPVGEMLRELKTFRYKNGLIVTEYQLNVWNGDVHAEGKTNYQIKQWTKEAIVLQKLPE